MVDISSGADFVQDLVAIFKERHQADLARIVIFCFLRMGLFVPLSESQSGQLLCLFYCFNLFVAQSLKIVVLDLDSSLFVFFYLEVHHFLHDQLMMPLVLIIHRWLLRFDLAASKRL